MSDDVRLRRFRQNPVEAILDGIAAKLPGLSGGRVPVQIGNDAENPVPVVAGFSIPKHDYAELSYTGSDLTGVTYKLGGTWNSSTDTYTGGTTVFQLELVYSGGNLVKIVEV